MLLLLPIIVRPLPKLNGGLACTLANTIFTVIRPEIYITSNFASSGTLQKQIENGGPITITHPDITRYFMTIPEASQLVLEAASMGKGGEIFVFNMGDSVKIVDLARKMIMLLGMKEGKDISIVYTGLRPGEKLYEELLNDQENSMPTHHPKIMIAKVKEYDYEIISREVSELISLFDSQNNEDIVKRMKQIVPEFISNNSVFEKLDKNTGELPELTESF